MNDHEYTFIQTSKERKQLSRGAYAKKGGSRSKKCSLPSDNLTKKQLRERNGEMRSYNLKEPMSYKDFKGMPLDLQVEYLDKLVNVHRGRVVDVAEMMGTSANTLSAYCLKTMGKKGLFNNSPKKKQQSIEWLNFINGEIEAVEEPKIEEVTLPSEDDSVQHSETSEVKQALDEARVEEMCIKMTGTPGEIIKKILMPLDMNSKYEATVVFKLIEE